MITSEDKEILESVETKLIASVIKQTILIQFKFYKIQPSNEVNMYYIKPEIGERYIEVGDIVDIYLNEQYKELKKRLSEHYVVRKYTRFIDKPFKREKIYHFMIENYTYYYDFYLVCESMPGPYHCYYTNYKLYANEITFTSK